MSDVEASDMTRLERAVRADLTRWGLADSSLAAATIDVVERLGDPDLRPAAAAMLHQRLDGYLADLRKLAPVEDVDDAITGIRDEFTERRRAAGLA